MAKRPNVLLSEETVRALARKAALQKRLKQAVIRDRDLTAEIAQDWFFVDQDVSWSEFGSSKSLVKPADS